MGFGAKRSGKRARLGWAIFFVIVLALVSGVSCRGRSVCPTPSAAQKALTDQEHGYCLLYPSEYESTRPNESETVIYQGSLLNVTAPRAYLTVHDADGRSLEAIVQARLAEFAGFAIRRTEATVDGVAAVILDGVPGQDIGRELLMVRGSWLYQLSFVPLGEGYPAEVVEHTEELYALVLESWRFLAD